MPYDRQPSDRPQDLERGVPHAHIFPRTGGIAYESNNLRGAIGDLARRLRGGSFVCEPQGLEEERLRGGLGCKGVVDSGRVLYPWPPLQCVPNT